MGWASELDIRILPGIGIQATLSFRPCFFFPAFNFTAIAALTRPCVDHRPQCRLRRWRSRSCALRASSPQILRPPLAHLAAAPPARTASGAQRGTTLTRRSSAWRRRARAGNRRLQRAQAQWYDSLRLTALPTYSMCALFPATLRLARGTCTVFPFRLQSPICPPDRAASHMHEVRVIRPSHGRLFG